MIITLFVHITNVDLSLVRSRKSMKCKLLCLILLGTIASCKPEDFNEQVIYSSDFEDGAISQIRGGQISSYEMNNVLGRFNNSSIKLDFDLNKSHDFIRVEFDLYIHDTWEGNNFSDSGPDVWGISIRDKGYLVNRSVYVFETTFSNGVCVSSFCQPQSYPDGYPSYNFPGSGAFASSVSACFTNSKTTIYHVDKAIPHHEPNFTLTFYDRLKQTRGTDLVCNESWSIDNLIIKAVQLE